MDPGNDQGRQRGQRGSSTLVCEVRQLTGRIKDGKAVNKSGHRWRGLHWKPLRGGFLCGVLAGFRWCILGSDAMFNFGSFCMSMAITDFSLRFGLRQFRKTERSFAELI